MILSLKADEKARLFGLPVVNLFQKRANYSSLILIPESIAEKYKTICFENNEINIKVATANPEDEFIISFLENLKVSEKKTLEIYVSTPESIEYALEWYKDENLNPEALNKELKREKEIIEKKINKFSPLESYTSLDTILDHAIFSKASEVHLECIPEYARIFYHVNGLHEIAKIPEPVGSKLVGELKQMSHLRSGHIHQKGDFFKLYKNEFYHIVTTIFPMPVGIKVNIEISDMNEDRFNLSRLGMQEETIKSVLHSLRTDNGLFLVTGNFGSGRTYTMYALLSLFMKKGKKVATVENDIDCFIDGFKQLEVRPLEGKTYISGLKEVIQSGYDSILLDGLRDTQTARYVQTEVSRDKIIVVPFSDQTISGAVYHLEELGFTKDQIARDLKLIINQRLLLKLCPNCRVEKSLSPSDKEDIKKEINNLPKTSNHSNIKLKEYMHSGCPSCNATGFSGHIAIFEALPIDDEIRSLIINGTLDIKEKDILKKKGLISLKQDGLIKVSEGVTTLDEIERVS
ncbi:Flp pilus assembly complex ATPase component TadA [bacterium]|nr:Flp pilus assembly complex ATPase component TadA [bacterium]